MKRVSCTLFAAAAFVLNACGGGNAEKPAAETPHDEDAQTAQRPGHHGGPSVSQELGEIDPKEAERAFSRIQPRVAYCQKESAGRLEYIAGELRVFARVDANGQTRYTFLEGSTLGDRQTEKCILDAVAGISWPKPVGGEAEVRKTYSFDGGDAREPTAWSKEKMFDAIAKAQNDLDRCKAGVSGTFAVTAYVVPMENGSGGAIQAVGVAPPSNDGESKVDCLVKVIKQMRPPSPGSYAAKVSFTL